MKTSLLEQNPFDDFVK